MKPNNLPNNPSSNKSHIYGKKDYQKSQLKRTIQESSYFHDKPSTESNNPRDSNKITYFHTITANNDSARKKTRSQITTPPKLTMKSPAPIYNSIHNTIYDGDCGLQATEVAAAGNESPDLTTARDRLTTQVSGVITLEHSRDLINNGLKIALNNDSLWHKFLAGNCDSSDKLKIDQAFDNTLFDENILPKIPIALHDIFGNINNFKQYINKMINNALLSKDIHHETQESLNILQTQVNHLEAFGSIDNLRFAHTQIKHVSDFLLDELKKVSPHKTLTNQELLRYCQTKGLWLNDPMIRLRMLDHGFILNKYYPANVEIKNKMETSITGLEFINLETNTTCQLANNAHYNPQNTAVNGTHWVATTQRQEVSSILVNQKRSGNNYSNQNFIGVTTKKRKPNENINEQLDQQNVFSNTMLKPYLDKFIELLTKKRIKILDHNSIIEEEKLNLMIRRKAEGILLNIYGTPSLDNRISKYTKRLENLDDLIGLIEELHPMFKPSDIAMILKKSRDSALEKIKLFSANAGILKGLINNELDLNSGFYTFLLACPTKNTHKKIQLLQSVYPKICVILKDSSLSTLFPRRTITQYLLSLNNTTEISDEDPFFNCYSKLKELIVNPNENSNGYKLEHFMKISNLNINKNESKNYIKIHSNRAHKNRCNFILTLYKYIETFKQLITAPLNFSADDITAIIRANSKNNIPLNNSLKCLKDKSATMEKLLNDPKLKLTSKDITSIIINSRWNAEKVIQALEDNSETIKWLMNEVRFSGDNLALIFKDTKNEFNQAITNLAKVKEDLIKISNHNSLDKIAQLLYKNYNRYEQIIQVSLNSQPNNIPLDKLNNFKDNDHIKNRKPRKTLIENIDSEIKRSGMNDASLGNDYLDLNQNELKLDDQQNNENVDLKEYSYSEYEYDSEFKVQSEVQAIARSNSESYSERNMDEENSILCSSCT